MAIVNHRHGLAAALFVGLASAADAKPRTHDGFLLRAHLGPSWTGTDSTLTESGHLRMRAAGVEIGLAVGGCIWPNLAIHGDMVANGGSPAVETPVGRSTLNDGTLVLVALGGGLSYWLPADFVLSSSVVMTTISVDGFGADPERRAGTDPGVGVSFLAGKDWFVSDEWSLGVAARIIHGRLMAANDDDGAGPEQGSSTSATSIGVLFGVTYN